MPYEKNLSDEEREKARRDGHIARGVGGILGGFLTWLGMPIAGAAVGGVANQVAIESYREADTGKGSRYTEEELEQRRKETAWTMYIGS